MQWSIVCFLEIQNVADCGGLVDMGWSCEHSFSFFNWGQGLDKVGTRGGTDCPWCPPPLQIIHMIGYELIHYQLLLMKDERVAGERS